MLHTGAIIRLTLKSKSIQCDRTLLLNMDACQVSSLWCAARTAYCVHSSRIMCASVSVRAFEMIDIPSA